MMNNSRPPISAVPCIGFALLFAPIISIQADPPSALGKIVEDKIAEFRGHVSLYARNLSTGAAYGLRDADPVRTASTIKLAIMVECFFEAQEGKLRWDQMIRLDAAEKVAGSGVLTEFSDGDQIPVKDLMHLMIVVSDNTATNLILNRITGDAVNARMQSMGLTQTRVMRKILNGDAPLSGITMEGAKPENKKWGIGRSSPREMVTILERIYKKDLVSPEASAEMLAVLKRQQDRHGIARDRKDVDFAGKSGALDRLRGEAAIVWIHDQPIAMAITVDDIPETDWTHGNPGQALIASLSEILIGGLAGPAKLP